MCSRCGRNVLPQLPAIPNVAACCGLVFKAANTPDAKGVGLLIGRAGPDRTLSSCHRLTNRWTWGENCGNQGCGKIARDRIPYLTRYLGGCTGELILALRIVEAHRPGQFPVLQHPESDVQHIWMPVDEHDSPWVGLAR